MNFHHPIITIVTTYYMYQMNIFYIGGYLSHRDTARVGTHKRSLWDAASEGPEMPSIPTEGICTVF